MKDTCLLLCTNILVSLGPLALAAVTTALILLTHWILGPSSDSNRRS